MASSNAARNYRIASVHENPFVANSELSHKADYIIQHSTISRTEVKIVDPDNKPPLVEERIDQVSAPQAHSTPTGKGRDINSNAEQGKDEKKKDKKKKKCCLIQ